MCAGAVPDVKAGPGKVAEMEENVALKGDWQKSQGCRSQIPTEFR